MARKKHKANELVVVPQSPDVTSGQLTLPPEQFPTLITQAGGAAQFAYEEFMLARIRNPRTRQTYTIAINQFLSWCQQRSLPLPQITPGDVGSYFDQHPGKSNTKNTHLSAIRHLFDRLVLRHVIVLNPAHSVRGEKHQAIEGQTPPVSPETTAKLLASIDTTNIVGLRDYTIIATLAYTLARVGAVAKLTRSSLQTGSDDWQLKFNEKGGKQRVIPVRHDLKVCLRAYLEAADLDHAPKRSPLFRSTIRREKRLTKHGLSGHAMCRMFKRRLKDAALPNYLSPHGVRGGGATDLLEQGVPREEVQYLLGHSDPRTTDYYDHRRKRVTRNVVERLSAVVMHVE